MSEKVWQRVTGLTKAAQQRIDSDQGVRMGETSPELAREAEERREILTLRELDRLAVDVGALAEHQLLELRAAGVPFSQLGTSKQQGQQRWRRAHDRQERSTPAGRARLTSSVRPDPLQREQRE
jgi:hypothetical protein